MNTHPCLTLSGAAIGAIGGLTATLALDLPSGNDLPLILASPQITVEARYLAPGAEGEYIRHAVCRCGLRLSPGEIPLLVKQALLAQEDIRFYVHSGIDWIGLGRASRSVVVSAVSGGSLQGGSTLTQQLVKNLITGNARTGLPSVVRKIREALIARRIEGVMTKDAILAAYLNQMDFGSTDGLPAIGIAEAARRYFGRPAKDLNLYEAAMLVGTLRGTTRYNPVTSPEAAHRQARAVLDKMLGQGRISQGAYLRALRQGARIAYTPGARVAPYYVAWAYPQLAWIAATRPRGSAGRPGLIRYVVGLDPELQMRGEMTIRAGIAGSGGHHVSQGALVAIDGDGRVAALVGGTDFTDSQFDRATQARRQPGSAFKVFVYTAAINAGLSPWSIRYDRRVAIGSYAPENADRRYLGPMTLMKAFALSRNTVAVQIGAEVGTGTIANLAHQLGIRSPLPADDPTLVLGTSEVTLLDLSSAYVPFMNGGHPVRPYAARMAINAGGEVIWRRNEKPLRPALGAAPVQAIREMLHAVVTVGTGRQARLRNRWSAGKTGTSQRDRDAWFIGFTDRLTTGVWFGNDDGSPMVDVSGGSMPAQAWRAFNEAIDAPPVSETAGGAARAGRNPKIDGPQGGIGHEALPCAFAGSKFSAMPLCAPALSKTR
jgi:penicillin-binding protein 1A